MKHVRVPATIANLGTGFDVLAMAVDLWLEVRAEPADRPEWTFEGIQPPPGNPFDNLPMRGTVRSDIPLGVGLGSSAAARIAALRLAGVHGHDLLRRAAETEGHPDNVAAAVTGGLVANVGGEVHRLPAPDLEVAIFVAAVPSPTEDARAMLTPKVDRADAVHNLGRMVYFLSALFTRDWSRLRMAMDDRLHQPERTAIYPWLPAALDAGYAAGALGAALAGAGPSVFAFCDGESRRVAEAMGAAAGIEGRPLTTRIALL